MDRTTPPGAALPASSSVSTPSGGFQPVPTHDADDVDSNPFMPAGQFGSNSGGYNAMNDGNGGSAWLEKQQKGSKRHRWIVRGTTQHLYCRTHCLSVAPIRSLDPLLVSLVSLSSQSPLVSLCPSHTSRAITSRHHRPLVVGRTAAV